MRASTLGLPLLAVAALAAGTVGIARGQSRDAGAPVVPAPPPRHEPAPGAAPAPPGGAAAQSLQAVFHLSDPGQEPNARGLRNALNALRALGDEPAHFVLVVHGGALRWFLRTEPANLGAPLAAVLATGKAEWRVCRVTLEQNHWSESQLLPNATVVPSGTLEVLRLQQHGFAYFHP